MKTIQVYMQVSNIIFKDFLILNYDKKKKNQLLYFPVSKVNVWFKKMDFYICTLYDGYENIQLIANFWFTPPIIKKVYTKLQSEVILRKNKIFKGYSRGRKGGGVKLISSQTQKYLSIFYYNGHYLLWKIIVTNSI